MIYVDHGGAELARQLLATKEPFCVVELGSTMWRYHPDLGLHVADIDSFGNVVLTEHRLRAIMDAVSTKAEIEDAINEALGTAWDAQLAEDMPDHMAVACENEEFVQL